MCAVHRLGATDEVAFGAAVDRYLATLDGRRQKHTHRAYARTLRAAVEHFGADTIPDEIDA